MTEHKYNIEKIAELARLGLTKQEKGKFQNELEDILGYMDKLKTIDTEFIPPTDHVLGSTNITRPDRVVESDCQSIIDQAKKKDYQIPSVRTLWTS